jgi:hypothetical protein
VADVLARYGAKGRCYFTGDRVAGRNSDQHCSKLAVGTKGRRRGEEKNRRPPEKRKKGSVAAKLESHSAAEPEPLSAPASATPPLASPLSPPAPHFFSVDGEPHPTPLSFIARLRLAPSETMSSPPLLPSGRTGVAGAVSWGAVVTVVAEVRTEPWFRGREREITGRKKKSNTRRPNR